ncbi:hypothetical protein ACFL4Y_00035 [Gemmatimonadota bacterium]
MTRMAREVADLPPYVYRGARALVLLHEQELREFITTWLEARATGSTMTLAGTSEQVSLDELLHHVLCWARDYMVWTCEKLGLPDPEIDPVPAPDALRTRLPRYLDHLLARWRLPLAGVAEEPLFSPQHTTRWNIDYPIEALLEHAVVHAMRHRLQLQEMIEKRSPPEG